MAGMTMLNLEQVSRHIQVWRPSTIKKKVRSGIFVGPFDPTHKLWVKEEIDQWMGNLSSVWDPEKMRAVVRSLHEARRVN